MGYVFYDTETSGLDNSFCQILQFAAIHTDYEFNEIERFNIRCRILPGVVPSPGAMHVTKVTVDQLIDRSLPSSYEMISEIRSKLISWSPAVFIGYNSLQFDEKFLRNEFYKNLFPAYLTNTNRNSRMDALRLIQSASVLNPQCLNIPIGENGGKIYKLDQLAPLNGFSHMNAHDALADVEAMIYLCRHVYENAPDAWSNCMRFTQKAAVLDFSNNEDIFCFYDFYFGKPFFYTVTSLGESADNSGYVYLFDLKTDPVGLGELSDESLKKALSKSPKPLRRIKINSCPMLLHVDDLPSDRAIAESDQKKFLDRSAYLRSNRQLINRFIQCYEELTPAWENSVHVEKQLYQAFVPNDLHGSMELFHRLPWESRYQHSLTFSDDRLRELAVRIIFYEDPALLPETERRRVTRLLAERILSPAKGSAWVTMEKAMQELDEIGNAAASSANMQAHLQYISSLRSWAESELTVA